MTFLFVVAAWVVLAMISWPIALLLLVAVPFLWLLSIPFRIVGIALHAVLALIRAILFLPARILGAR